MKKPTNKDLVRWATRARRVFTAKTRHDGTDYDRQSERAVELARDVFRTLAPAGWRRLR